MFVTYNYSAGENAAAIAPVSTMCSANVSGVFTSGKVADSIIAAAFNALKSKKITFVFRNLIICRRNVENK